MNYQPVPIVYLIDDGRWFKIGYTGNPKLRTQRYITENPTAKVIETISFNTKQQGKHHERKIHEALADYQVHGNSKEWFERCDVVFNFFFRYRNDLGFGAPHVDSTAIADAKAEEQAKIDAAKAEVDDWKRKYREAEEQRSLDTDELSEELDQIYKDYNATVDKRDALREQYNSLVGMYNSLAEEKNKLQEEYDTLVSHASVLLDACNTLEEQVGDLRKAKDDIEERYWQLQQQHARINA